ncbi:serine/threonine protein kinase [Actinomadura sp. KC06]|uniref:serine/threonine-protein kinase n=1 Tax=Actinomadura sp. KC06 TaxID=2530369 RepID=UPI0010473852|nr:serine/threonine-protein kinase [Actinomadura sp. KC06]TDD32912.1 serine/threonine protein kinase [Actinomadura sp. KC06]
MSTTLQDVQQLIAATGKYTFEAENTEGANAYAFRARHVPLDLPVFLKVLYPDPSGDLFAEPRPLVEATSSEGNGSNLVSVHDAQRLGNDFVLVAMEYVDGGSILSRLSGGPLPLMEAVCAAIGILRGLAQLHQALLVHRDIKPANVLISQRHGRTWPKITDFGSVARLAHASASVSASRHSALYVPTEGWGTPSRYDVRSDLYQVGLVLFEMVHGALPYNDDAYVDREARMELRDLAMASGGGVDDFDRQQVVDRALARAASGQGVISFGRMQPYVPKSLARIVNKAVSPDRVARYQTPSEMICDLEVLRLSDWRLAPCGEQYAANGWSGWDWSIRKDPKKAEQRVILRSRKAATNFRRWATAESARAACQLVMEAAA